MDSNAVSVPAAQRLLNIVHFAYPIILLVTFLVAFTARSIILSREASKSASEPEGTRTGPGGKPLPQKKSKPQDKDKSDVLDFSKPRKLLFEWLSVILSATFVASAGDVIAHALIKRDEGWWCGQAPVVRHFGIIKINSTTDSPSSSTLLAASLSMLFSSSRLSTMYLRPRPRISPHGR